MQKLISYKKKAFFLRINSMILLVPKELWKTLKSLGLPNKTSFCGINALNSLMKEVPIILKPVHWNTLQNWFLYNWDLRHERIKVKNTISFETKSKIRRFWKLLFRFSWQSFEKIPNPFQQIYLTLKYNMIDILFKLMLFIWHLLPKCT